MEENKVIKGYIEEAVVKSGNTNGKEWKRSVIKVNGKILASFDMNCAQDIFDGKLKTGVPVEISYKTDGKYNNIISIIPTEAKEFQTADKVKTREVDWDGKERRIIRQNVLNRAVELFLSNKVVSETLDDPTDCVELVGRIANKLEEWVWKEGIWKEKEGVEYEEKTI